MNDFEKALDDCLVRMARNGTSIRDCLTLYPQYAKDLEPLLSAAKRLQASQAVRPSAPYRQRARAYLRTYANANPPRRPITHIPAWRTAFASAALGVVLLFTTTAFAQEALPGQTLYGLKRSSEEVWRALSPDPVGVDLVLTDRRADELARVQDDPSLEAETRDAFHEVLLRLAAEDNPGNGPRIDLALQAHEKSLSAAGIHDDELEKVIRGRKGKP